MRQTGHRLRHVMLVALQALVAGSRKDLLDLDARRRLHEYVTKYPGLHLREIARETGLEMNHAKYHLLYMQKHGLISSRRDEGYWRFFPLEEGRVGWQDQVPATSKAALGLLRRPIPLHITLLLLENELNQSQILEQLNVAASTLHYHLGRMEQAGLMVSERRGRERICRLADPKQVVGLLVRYRPPPALVADFLDAWENLDLDALSRRHAEPSLGPSSAEGEEIAMDEFAAAPGPAVVEDELPGTVDEADEGQDGEKEGEKSSGSSLRSAAG